MNLKFLKERKLDTIKMLSEIRMKYPKIFVLSYKAKKKYIKELEFFATDVNQKNYDIKIVSKMSGSRLIYQYEKYLKKIIKRIRKEKEDSKEYIEYEEMINKLKKYKKYKEKDDMKTTLVIMAAGIGSRFGGGIKQLAPVGLNGEIIMDYSIHDAIEAGFNKIVFIIRKDIKDAFKEAIGDRIEKICNNLDVEIAYAYQELSELPEGVELPTGRTKPWGTGHAVLACKEVLHEPFAVINADDYYGKEAFVKLHDFLVGYIPEKANQFCMAGFILKNTLSENGAVTRGICETNEEGYLTAVHETSNIVKTPEGAAVDNDGQLTSINAESYASMNMWGLTPEFMQILEDGFKEFFANMGDKDILKAEYLLPIYIDELLQAGKVSVKVLDTNDKWFGITYKEDKDYVVKSFARLIEDGVYQKKLFEDLK